MLTLKCESNDNRLNVSYGYEIEERVTIHVGGGGSVCGCSGVHTFTFKALSKYP